jgi:hypothetical protein
MPERKRINMDGQDAQGEKNRIEELRISDSEI